MSGDITIIIFIFIISLIVFVFLLYKMVKRIAETRKKWDMAVEIFDASKDLLYIRDVPSLLSPACVSYLVDDKEESKKKVISNILSLIRKKAIAVDDSFNLKKDEVDGKILTEDEKYIYDWLFNADAILNIDEFQSIIKKETRHLIKMDKKELFGSFVGFGIFIGWAYGLISVVLIKLNLDFYNRIFHIFIFVVVILIFISFGLALFLDYISEKNINNKQANYSFKSYTKLGIEEASRWLKFKDFIKDYGNLENVKLKEIVIWDKYLAYAVALDINEKYEKYDLKKIKEKLNLNL